MPTPPSRVTASDIASPAGCLLAFVICSGIALGLLVLGAAWLAGYACFGAVSSASMAVQASSQFRFEQGDE